MLLGVSPLALADTVTVNIANNTAVTLYVSFTTLNFPPPLCLLWQRLRQYRQRRERRLHPELLGQTCIAAGSDTASKLHAILGYPPRTVLRRIA